MGKTKLLATQVIDTNFNKFKDIGVQSVDVETISVINEQIQKLNDMGDFEHIKLLKTLILTRFKIMKAKIQTKYI